MPNISFTIIPVDELVACTEYRLYDTKPMHEVVPHTIAVVSGQDVEDS
jgi:hypothetical protein